jgi:hypothetical protein
MKRDNPVNFKPREAQILNSGTKQLDVEQGTSSLGLRKRCERKVTKQNHSPLPNKSVVIPGIERGFGYRGDGCIKLANGLWGVLLTVCSFQECFSVSPVRDIMRNCTLERRREEEVIAEFQPIVTEVSTSNNPAATANRLDLIKADITGESTGEEIS